MKTDDLVLQAIIAEIADYTPNLHSLNMNSSHLVADLFEEFSKTYKDAGSVIGKTMSIFGGE